jgi:hypothetical protein
MQTLVSSICTEPAAYTRTDSSGIFAVSLVLTMSSPNPTVDLHFVRSNQFRGFYLMEELLARVLSFEDMESWKFPGAVERFLDDLGFWVKNTTMDKSEH